MYSMSKDKYIIFFQGGGNEDYDVDAELVASLKAQLGTDYSVHYPRLNDEEMPDYGRRKQIGQEISATADDVILVGHSLGASMLLVYLSEYTVVKNIKGIFLMSTPFWSGSEDWVKPLKLQPDFMEKLDKKIPLFFYHCQDDDVVPVSHLDFYRQRLPWATFREIPVGGHQFNNDLSVVAKDIRALS